MRIPRLALSAVLLLSLPALSCRSTSQSAEDEAELNALNGAPGYKVQYMGMPLRAIDVHMHPGTYDSVGPIGKDFLRSVLPEFLPRQLKDLSLGAVSKLQLDPYGAFIGIKIQCEAAGMSACGLMSVYAPETWGVTTREDVLGYLNDKRNKNKETGKPFYFGWASVRMQDWDKNEKSELHELRKALQHPLVKGIKLAFIHNNIPLDDARYDSIYEVAAELDVPVYHHVGSSPLRKLSGFAVEEQEEYRSSYDPARLERAIAKYPKTKFILGHMGFDFNKEGYDFTPQVYELAKKYPNVYLEISAFGRATYDPDGKAMDGVLRTLKEEGMLPRTIYGSDGPGTPGGTKKYIESTLASFQRVGYSVAEAEAVLSKNTEKLFKLTNF